MLPEEEGNADAIMKMLFPPNDGAKVKEVRKKLSNAGIRCRIKKIPLAYFSDAASKEINAQQEKDVGEVMTTIDRRLRDLDAMGIVNKDAASVYRYMNFDQIEEYAETAKGVTA